MRGKIESVKQRHAIDKNHHRANLICNGSGWVEEVDVCFDHLAGPKVQPLRCGGLG